MATRLNARLGLSVGTTPTNVIDANGSITANSVIVANTFTIGANVIANSSTIAVGNSTVNTWLLNTGITLGSSGSQGIGFYQSIDNYFIAMKPQAVSMAGRLDSTSDFNMYFQMNGGTNRGFIFRGNNAVDGAVSQIDASGNFYTRGIHYVGVGTANAVLAPTYLSLSNGTVTTTVNATAISTNGTLTVANTAALGNTTINGWANVTSNLQAVNVRTTGDVQIDGNLTVSGNTVTIGVTNLAVEDNMIYLNEGSTIANPDLGIVGNYNDGTYRHAGFFRDATDGVWKVFDQYVPEPNGAFVDTSNNTFRIADFRANNTVLGTANVAGTTNLGTGSANYLRTVGAAGGLTPVYSSQGSDTNIGQIFQTKGTGGFDIAAGSSGVNISNGGGIIAAIRTAYGSGYTSLPTPSVPAPTTPGGVQAVLATSYLLAVSATVAAGGTGYTVNDVLTLVGGTFSTATTVTVVSVSGGVVTGVLISNNGNYSVAPSTPATTTGGTGTGCTINISYGINGVNVTTAGSGYVEQPAVSFSGGSGSGAAAYVTVGSIPKIQTLGSSLSFYVPGGEAFRIVDTGGTTGNYWQAMGTLSTAILRSAHSTNSAQVHTGGTGAVLLGTNGGVTQLAVAHTAASVNYLQVTGSTTGSGTGVLMSAEGSDSNVNVSIRGKGTGYINLGSQQANYWQMYGAATTATPSLYVWGTDTNVGMNLVTKGAGNFSFQTNGGGTAATQVAIVHVASAVNYVQMNGAATGAGPGMTFTGSDSSVVGTYNTKGAGAHQFYTNSNPQFRINDTVSAVNYLTVTGSATGNQPLVSVQGSDTNISVSVSSKGAGSINFWTNTSSNRQFAITHTASAVNYIQATGSATGSAVSLSAQGTDANVAIGIASKGDGSVYGIVNGATVFDAYGPTSSVNYLRLRANATGNAPSLQAMGTDTNIGITYATKGTGVYNFNTGNGTQFQINDTYIGSGAAANYFAVYGHASGYTPRLMVAGTDAVIGMILSSKSSGDVSLRTNNSAQEQLRVSHTASAVNYLQATGSATGAAVSLTAQGSDANVGISFAGKGTGTINLNSNTTFNANTLLFTGTNTAITMRVADNGVLSFEGNTGQLFSITNSLTGQLFAVNDISGIPSIEVYSNGQVNMARYGGNVAIGSALSTTTIAGSVTSSGALNITAGANAITLTNATSNYIAWAGAGVAAPTVSTRSAGTKLLLFPDLTSSQVDYAIGVETNHVWFSAGQGALGGFKWYANTTNIMTSNAAGLAINSGQLNVGANAVVNTSAVFLGNSTVNTVITQTTAAFNANSTLTALYVAANGNVGIGNATPTTKLLVSGGAPWFKPNDTGAAAAALQLGRFSDNDTAAFSFITNDATGDTLTIKSERYNNYSHWKRNSGNGEVYVATLEGINGTRSEFNIYHTETDNTVKVRLSTGTDSFINSAANVGIGTSTPNAKLQVVGTANINGSVAVSGDTAITGNVAINSAGHLTLNGALSSNALIQTSAYHSTNATLYVEHQAYRHYNGLTSDKMWTWRTLTGASAPSLIMSTSSEGAFTTFSDVFTIGANGNIGIGTTTPTRKLWVNGGMRLGAGNGSVLVEGNHVWANGDASRYFTLQAPATENVDDPFTFNTVNSWAFLTDSATRLTINDAGATVNGNIIVSGNLTVSGTTTYVNTTNLNIGDNIITLNADLGAVAPTENAGFEVNRGTSSNSSLYWDETIKGWVASPGNDANNDFRIVSNTYVSGTSVAAGGLSTYWGNTTNTSAYASFAIGSGVNKFRTQSRDYIIANTASDMAAFAANGNFGIGNTSPTKKLVVEGNTRIVGDLRMGPEGEDAATRTISSGGDLFIRANDTGTDGSYSVLSLEAGPTAGAGAITLKTNNVQRMLVAANGNVGVGTSTPYDKFHVAHDSNTQGTATFFNANNDATAKSIITLAANTTSMVMYQNAPNSTSGEWGLYSGSATTFKVSTNAVSRFVISANGNIGVGTGAPGSPLSVVVAANTTSIASYYTGSTGGGAEIRSTNGFSSTSPIYSFWYNNNTGIGNPAANETTVIANGAEIIRFAANGNMGVGHNAPVYPIHVLRNANTAVAEIRVENANTGTGAQARFNMVTASAFSYALHSLTDGTTPQYNIGTGPGVTGGMVINAANAALTLSANSVTSLKIFANNNIAIGANSTPTEKLRVEGTFSHTGLIPSTGTGIDQIYTATPSVTLNTTWQSTGVTATNLANGSYMVQLFANDVAAGGTANNEYYTGIMSWYSADTDSTVIDEIPLHRAGKSGSNNSIFLATQRTATANTSDLILMISSAANNSSSSTYTLKFRRMI